MKSYLGLIPISAKTRRKQNRLTRICIILSVFLVTAVFSMADILLEGEKNAMIKKHGNYHIMISGISEDEAGRIAGQKEVAAFAECHVLNYEMPNTGYYIGAKNLILYGTEQAYINNIRNYETEGSFPQSDTEVMLSADAKEGLGVQIGDSVTVNTPAGNFDYAVSGFCVDDTEYNVIIDGVCSYMNADGFDRILSAGQENAEKGYYIRFGKKAIKKAIADIKTQYGLAAENVKENTSFLALVGASSSKAASDLYPSAAVAFLIILAAGVLMISSCMNSNISQRTQFFGMMRCIGANKTQIIRYVRLEALNWCKSAVPIGCLLGTASAWIMIVFLKNMVGGEFAELSFRPSIIALLFGTAVGVTTVLIAARSPAKRAAGVSPVAAVSGNADTGKKIVHAANTHLFKIETALGVHHAAAAKKNLILMTLSFALTIILFFTFFALLDFARKLIPSMSNFAPDISIVGADSSTNSIGRNLADEISKLSGVEKVFGTAFVLNTPADVNGAERNIDLISYDDFMMNLSKKSVVSGDISKITEDSDYVLTIFNVESRFDVGDKIKTGGAELEIACVVSEGIGGWGRPLVVCTDKTFQRVTGEDGYALINVQLTKDAAEETVNAIRNLTGDNEFADRREEKLTDYSSYWVFRIAAYGFLAIIALITIFNIMNSISMSVSARIKQYGAMRAVGMGARQLTKMIASEAVTYAACGLLVGCSAGLFLHRLIMVKLVVTHFGGHWKIPWETIAVIVPIVVLSCIAAVHAPAKRIREMAVTETINEL